MGRTREGSSQRRWPSARAAGSVALLACCGLVLVGKAVVAERALIPTGESPVTGVTVDRTAQEAAEEPFVLTTIMRSLLHVYKHVWPGIPPLVFSTISLSDVGFFFFFLSFALQLAGMIMGAACSTVYYNLRMRHPTMNLPVIDYDLALLFQPMLILGISIGVTFNVIFPDWVVTVLLIILFLGTSTRAFIKGIETWKKETIMKKEAARRLETSAQINDSPSLSYRPLPGGPAANIQIKSSADDEAPFLDNVCWKDFMLLLFVWMAFLAVQIVKTFAKTCSTEYWILNALQVPIAAAVTLYEAISLYNGKRTITSRGKQDISWKVHQFLLYCFCGILAGIVGGLLGLGGGFILGPLFLELGVPPQVASATSTFTMAFSSSMSVVQYYLLDRFPVPYGKHSKPPHCNLKLSVLFLVLVAAAYFILLATIAAFTGQHIVRKLIMLLGRASLIIFVLALTIFVSAISLGGVGIANMVKKLEMKEYMGFENLCHH
ncbi:hypothetical protein Taro_015836 [Colocasia esculenta]|uniref:Sulfite exporter TauE/SafE family protein 3 n=1 Tax=Colocasia esculenta TaxID=4460 RepID=A0A843UIL3_COLES|nr:hypothetical protein [Colocasia esculenta]